MVDVLQETEDAPASRPAITLRQLPTEGGTGPLNELGRRAAEVPLGPLWARLEDWASYRWGERAVSWVVDGPGDWTPRLRPVVTFDTTEVWHDGWTPVTLATTPLGGLELPGGGPYRIVATVGDTSTVPAEVEEALRRLAFFIADAWEAPGGITQIDDLARPAAWPARAMHYSGAADLLRRYR
ncbi:MAG: hypothetical protein AAF416_18585 [Pseudomonadota bacterium]